jgi:cytochrome c oxidase subunit 2
MRLQAAGLLVTVTAALCSAGPVPAAGEPAAGKVVKMDAENWEFIPSEITVHQGERVVLKIHSIHSPHRFDLKEYGLKVPLPQDETTTIEFVADKPGTFVFRCGRPCGDGCPRMRGKLIVLAVPPAAGGDDAP